MRLCMKSQTSLKFKQNPFGANDLEWMHPRLLATIKYQAGEKNGWIMQNASVSIYLQCCSMAYDTYVSPSIGFFFQSSNQPTNRPISLRVFLLVRFHFDHHLHYYSAQVFPKTSNFFGIYSNGKCMCALLKQGHHWRWNEIYFLLRLKLPSKCIRTAYVRKYIYRLNSHNEIERNQMKPKRTRYGNE